MKNVHLHNFFYELVKKNMVLLQPMALALTGFVTFGLSGLAVGLSFSLIDQILLHYQYTTNKYLTHIFLGVTFGYSIYPSYILASITGTLGLVSIKNYFELFEDYYYPFPLLAGISGTSNGGMLGGISGIAVGTADEILIYFNTSNKHYLTFSLLSVNVVNPIFGNSLIANSLATGLGITLTKYEGNIDLSFKPLKLAKDIYSEYEKVIDNNALSEFSSEYFESILTCQIIIQKFTLVILKYRRDAVHLFENADVRNVNNFAQFNTIAQDFLFYLIMKSIAELFTYLTSDYFLSSLNTKLESDLRGILFSNNTILKLSSYNDSAFLIDNLRKDSKIISHEAFKLVSNNIFKLTNNMHSVAVLTLNSPDILLCSIIFSQFNQFVSTLLSQMLMLLDSKIKEQESIVSTHLKHDMQNIKVISERNGVDYTFTKISNLYDQLNQYELQKNQLSIILDVWLYFASTIDLIYNYYFIVVKVHKGELSFEDRTEMNYFADTMFDLLSINSKKSKEVDLVYKSLERIRLFLGRVFNDNPNYCKTSILRDFSNNEDEQNELELLQVIITIGNQTLLIIESINLVFGQVYGLIGDSGSGKTSLVSKIAGESSNYVCGEGIIKYPANSKIVIISQQDYFPLNATLEEVIFYPDDVNRTLSVDIKALLEKANLMQFQLDQKENWYDIFSGGQKKKVFIIAAIIKKPDILILDEAFNGLDERSIAEAQNLIKQNLTNVLVISVDHNVNANNKSGFYDNLLYVADKKLILTNGKHLGNQYNYQEEVSYTNDGVCDNEMLNVRSFLLGEGVCVF